MRKRWSVSCLIATVILSLAIDLQAADHANEGPASSDAMGAVRAPEVSSTGMITEGSVLTVPSASWRAPMVRTSSKGRNVWLASIVALAGANFADVMSSRNLAEHNPLLQNSAGGFDARKAVFVKAGATSALVLVQALLRKRAGDGHLDKSFTVVNAAAAGVVGATAARNFTRQR